MNCAEFEERIARYVGGDLAPQEWAALQRHVGICEVCAELARGLEADRLRLASRPPDAAGIDYAAMRREIRREVAQSRCRRRRLPALLAAAAILLAVGVATLRRTPRPGHIALPPPVLAQLPPAALPPASVRKAGNRRTQPRPQPRQELTLEAAIRMFEELDAAPPPSPAGSDSPVEMRIATRDPNVSIILLQESKGDSR